MFENRFRAELEATEEGKLVGYAAVFNSLSHDLGGFRENIEPGAFDRSLREFPDVLALFDHDMSKVLGRTSSGTLRLAQDERGLRVEIDLPNNTLGNDLRESVKRQDIVSMSFRFKPYPGGDYFDTTTSPPTRHLKAVQLKEVSVVVDPAYPDTSVSVRALEDARNEQTHALRRARLRLAEII